MIKNMGVLDRGLRILVAVVLVILYFTDQISGVAATILLVLAGVLIGTSFIGFCPLYLPFGVSTKNEPEV